MEKVKRYFFEVIVFHDGLPRIVSIEISIYQNVVNLDADSAITYHHFPGDVGVIPLLSHHLR